MKQIINRLYVGDEEDAPKALEQGFAVASMCKECPVGHRAMVGYTTLGAPSGEGYYHAQKGKHFTANLIDVENPDFIPEDVINPALDFIKKYYDKGDKVLIHCEQGRSRGPTTCMMFLRSIGEFPYSFKVSYKIFKTLYPKLDPGKGIEIYARRHWNELENYERHDVKFDG
jgi:hypothetical protein